MRKLEEIKPTTSVYDSTVRMKADDEKVYVWHPGKRCIPTSIQTRETRWKP
jgi:hypothetical protein